MVKLTTNQLTIKSVNISNKVVFSLIILSYSLSFHFHTNKMETIKFDEWWEQDYKEYSIKNYNSMPIFQKFFAIKSSYEITTETVHELFKATDIEKFLQWQTIDNKRGEKVGCKDDEGLIYYQKFSEEPNYRIEIDTRLTELCEQGQITIRYKTHDDVIVWSKTKDLITMKELSSADNELFLYELTKEGQKATSKGQVVYKEHSLRTSHKFEKVYDYARGSKKCRKTEIQTVKNFKNRSRSENIRFLKNRKVTVDREGEYGSVSKENNGEKYKKKWKITDNSKYEEESKETKDEESGVIIKKFAKDDYKIEWKILKGVFVCNVNGYRAGKRWTKRVKQLSLVTLEINDFDINNCLWGSIKDNSGGVSVDVEWTGRRPEKIYEECKRKILEPEKSLAENVAFDGKFYLNEIIEEAAYMFEYILFLQVNSFKFYSIEKSQRYHCNTLKLQNIQTGPSSAKISLSSITENIFAKLIQGANEDLSFLKNLSAENFSILLNHYEKLEGPLDLNEHFFQTFHMDNIIQELYKSKNKLYKFANPLEISLEFNKFRSLFENLYTKKQHLTEALNHISEPSDSSEPTENSSSQYIDIEDSITTIENSDLNTLICFNCNSACHEDCSLYFTTGFPQLGDKTLITCINFSKFTKKCDCCLRKCTYHSHYYGNKTIIKTPKTMQIKESIEDLNLALEDVEKSLWQLTLSIKNQGLSVKYISEVQRLLTLTSTALKDESEYDKTEELKKELNVLSDFGVLLASR